MVLLYVGSAMRTEQEGFARLLGAIQVLSKMASAANTGRTASAPLTIARLLQTQEDCVPGMAAPKCATLRAARRLLSHVAVALGMVRMDGASLMDAPPVQEKDSSIAANTVVGRRRNRAPWQAAPPSRR